jgi:hypothetical protein
MATQPQELGHVVGWTVVLSPGCSNEERIEVSTLAEWETARNRTSKPDADGCPRGGEFFTRIQGPNCVEESGGANPRSMPVGTKMILLSCRHCGEKFWFLYRPQYGPQTHCVCGNCNERRRYDRHLQDLQGSECDE